METTTLNVSGRRFEMSQETFQIISKSMSVNPHNTSPLFTRVGKEYFIERHADVFQNILYYFQTGELHMAHCVCPNLFRKELDFWGVDVTDLEKCCYNEYGLFRDNRETLKSFENYFKPNGTSAQSATSKWGKIRTCGWNLITDPYSSLLATIYFWVSMIIVVFNVVVVCLSTHPSFIGDIPIVEFPAWLQDYVARHYFEDYLETAEQYNTTAWQARVYQDITVPFTYPYIFLLEIACFGYFSIEQFFKILCCPSLKTFFTSPLHVLDLLAVLPFHVWLLLDAIAPYGSYITRAEDILEVVAVLRVLRLLRLARRIRGLRIILFSIRSSVQDIALLILMLFITSVVFSSLMYYVDIRSTFSSIPSGMWWAVVTMTTVGYGDVVPATWGGKLLGSLCAIFGVVIVALTVPVFVSKFQLFYTHTEKPAVIEANQNQHTRWLTKTKVVPFEK